MEGGIPDDSPFADSAFPDFELGLDQRQNRSVRFDERLHDRNDDAEGNERDIDDGKIHRSG